MTVPLSAWARIALVLPVTIVVLVISLMFVLSLLVPSTSMKKFTLDSSKQVLALVRAMMPRAR